MGLFGRIPAKRTGLAALFLSPRPCESFIPFPTALHPHPSSHPAGRAIQSRSDRSPTLLRAAALPLPINPLERTALALAWTASSLALYCIRRGSLHGLGAPEVARRHLIRDPGWPEGWRGNLGFSAAVISWLGLFGPLYPLLEVGLRPFGLASFWYYYPNANGAGLLVEELPPGGGSVASRPSSSERAGKERNSLGYGKNYARRGRQVFRLDWHRFKVNVGPPGRPYPRGGGVSRHPPSVEINRPHVDLPHIGVRHWPWRQHSFWMGLIKRENK